MKILKRIILIIVVLALLILCAYMFYTKIYMVNKQVKAINEAIEILNNKYRTVDNKSYFATYYKGDYQDCCMLYYKDNDHLAYINRIKFNEDGEKILIEDYFINLDDKNEVGNYINVVMKNELTGEIEVIDDFNYVFPDEYIAKIICEDEIFNENYTNKEMKNMVKKNYLGGFISVYPNNGITLDVYKQIEDENFISILISGDLIRLFEGENYSDSDVTHIGMMYREILKEEVDYKSILCDDLDKIVIE